MTSKLVARMEKRKAEHMNALGNHNDRKWKSHSNKDIDKDKSHLNYDLVDRQNKTIGSDVVDYINRNKSTSRALRKDAVLCNEWIITSDQDFFKGLSDSERDRFFKSSKEFFDERFGSDNVRSAMVHLDETTPHMHLVVIPFTKDKRLTSKEVFDRKTLLGIQEDLPRFLQERGFDIERGEKGSEKVHMDTQEFKNTIGKLEKARMETKELEDQVVVLEAEKHLLDAEFQSKVAMIKAESKRKPEINLRKTLWGFGKNYVFTPEEFEPIFRIARAKIKSETALDDYVELVESDSKVVSNFREREKALVRKEEELRGSLSEATGAKIRYKKLYNDQLGLNESYKALKSKYDSLDTRYQQLELRNETILNHYESLKEKIDKFEEDHEKHGTKYELARELSEIDLLNLRRLQLVRDVNAITDIRKLDNYRKRIALLEDLKAVEDKLGLPESEKQAENAIRELKRARSRSLDLSR